MVVGRCVMLVDCAGCGMVFVERLWSFVYFILIVALVSLVAVHGRDSYQLSDGELRSGDCAACQLFILAAFRGFGTAN